MNRLEKVKAYAAQIEEKKEQERIEKENRINAMKYRLNPFLKRVTELTDLMRILKNAGVKLPDYLVQKNTYSVYLNSDCDSVYVTYRGKDDNSLKSFTIYNRNLYSKFSYSYVGDFCEGAEAFMKSYESFESEALRFIDGLTAEVEKPPIKTYSVAFIGYTEINATSSEEAQKIAEKILSTKDDNCTFSFNSCHEKK